MQILGPLSSSIVEPQCSFKINHLELTVVATIAWLTILWLSHGIVVSKSSASLTTWSSSGTTNNTSFHISVGSSALPEWSLAGSAGVVVLWGWTISLLLASLLEQENLVDGCEQEQEDGDNGDSEDSSVEFTCCLEGERISVVEVLY